MSLLFHQPSVNIIDMAAHEGLRTCRKVFCAQYRMFQPHQRGATDIHN